MRAWQEVSGTDSSTHSHLQDEQVNVLSVATRTHNQACAETSSLNRGRELSIPQTSQCPLNQGYVIIVHSLFGTIRGCFGLTFAPYSYTEGLSPSTSECDCTGRYSL